MSMKTDSDYIWQHLAALPVFRALIRSIEHHLLADYKPFPAPILDVGAGDGHFAAAALGPFVDVGVDVSLASLREAQQHQVYHHLLSSSATDLPFPTESFATVISNCVIEHIPDLTATLAEMYRTLRPGGILLLTVPTNQLERNLIIPRILRGLRLYAIADAYIAWFRRVQVHYHLLSREHWVEALTDRGFHVMTHRGYMSVRATQFNELWHYAGWPNVLSRRLTGRWVIWAWRPRFFLIVRLLRKFVNEPEHTDDSCLFLVARKP